jgi:hypothetical protein
MTSRSVSVSALVDYNTQTIRVSNGLEIGNAVLLPEVVEFATFLHDNTHLVPGLPEAWCAHRTKKKLLR